MMVMLLLLLLTPSRTKSKTEKEAALIPLGGGGDPRWIADELQSHTAASSAAGAAGLTERWRGRAC